MTLAIDIAVAALFAAGFALMLAIIAIRSADAAFSDVNAVKKIAEDAQKTANDAIDRLNVANHADRPCYCPEKLRRQHWRDAASAGADKIVGTPDDIALP